MYRHIQEEHEGNIQNAELECGRSGSVKPVERQLSEAINIEKTSTTECLNSKMEYFHHNVKKIGLSGEEKRECKYCGRKFTFEKDIESHEKLFHIRYKCQDCEYLSFGEYDMKLHRKTVHDMKPFKCDKCGLMSNANKEYKDHTCCTSDKTHENN